jgi:hypothetical protein
MSYYVLGELDHGPDKSGMAEILRGAGLRIIVGRYSIRIENCSGFAFQVYGGDLGGPYIEAEAETLDELLYDAQVVSEALTRADVVHHFLIRQDDSDRLAGYLHHKWPLSSAELES